MVTFHRLADRGRTQHRAQPRRNHSRPRHGPPAPSPRARARRALVRWSQEANQLGGAVILPLIFLAVGQATGLLLVDITVALFIGALLWVVALALCARGAQRFTRDQLATRL